MRNLLLFLTLSLGIISDAKELKIGAVLPLTGPISSYGRDCLLGMKMAVDEVNAAGTKYAVHKKFTLIVKDNYGDREETRVKLEELAAENVSVIIGPLTSTNVIAVGPYIDSLRIPVIAPSATNPIVTKVSNLIFRICYTDEFQGETMAKFASYVLDRKKAALLVDTSQIYSKDLAKSFRECFENLGAEIVKEEYYSSTDVDFRRQLSEIRKMKPDCIFVPGYYPQVGLIIKQAREMGIPTPLLGGDGWDSPRLLDLTGKRTGTNFYCTHFFSKDPEVEDFRANYVSRFVLEPTSFCALGYDAIKLLAYLQLKDANCETIVNELSKVRDFKGVTGILSFKKSRDPIKSILILRVQHGATSVDQKITPGI
ncbi:MAG: ABC transporter substrate-binding protein [bacterium]|nr:ABC transporter substrate-binding protein [bacterium]